MLRRLVNPSKSSSFFLFGARGTGKSTFIKNFFDEPISLTIDLLLPDEYERYSLGPQLLTRQIKGLPPGSWVFIDEVQKVPDLLDLVHHHIEQNKIKFILSGSSARKLKRGNANLLAGRAFTYYLFPLTVVELGENYSLDSILRFGSLPKLLSLPEEEDKALFLESYTSTYINEEIWNEHLIRVLPPFRKFLNIAAQMNGEILNFSKIAADVGVDDKTVKSYFSILEDTLLGYFLEGDHTSIRKQQTLHPKFYFFDLGVKRAIDKTIRNSLPSGSSEFGKAFEHFIVVEIFRLNTYHRTNFTFSYLRTKDGAEVDLIIKRPGGNQLFVEIKSTDRITNLDIKHLQNFLLDSKEAQGMCLSNDPKSQCFGDIEALHWQEGIRKIFNSV